MLFTKKDAPERLFLRLGIGPYAAKSQKMRPGIAARDGGTAMAAQRISGVIAMTQTARMAVCLCLCCLTSLPAMSNPVRAGVARDAAVCAATHYDEKARIKYIHDGDTLRLKDGRKVRLIGINTPEVASRKKAAEPFSAEAKETLKALFNSNKTISLVYGKEKHDRYKRLLAHGFTSDGKNIQATLLTEGHARAITFPPNTQFSACYQQQERTARCNNAGLWGNSPPLAANKLNDRHIGFQLVRGKLLNINTSSKGVWLNLDNKLTIGIRPDNQSLFDASTLNKMLGQEIVVQGWLNKSRKATPTDRSYYIRIRHPSAIQLASSFACK